MWFEINFGRFFSCLIFGFFFNLKTTILIFSLPICSQSWVNPVVHRLTMGGQKLIDFYSFADTAVIGDILPSAPYWSNQIYIQRLTSLQSHKQWFIKDFCCCWCGTFHIPEFPHLSYKHTLIELCHKNCKSHFFHFYIPIPWTSPKSAGVLKMYPCLQHCWVLVLW